MVKFPWRSDDSGDSTEGYGDGAREHNDEKNAEPTDEDTGHAAGTSESEGDRQDDAGTVDPVPKDEAIVICEFQDGTLRVFADVLCIERRSRSKFSDKWIALNQVEGVRYERRLVINYLQIEQVDFQLSGEGLLSTPVDENTVHFGRGKRECAQRATDEILERMEQV